MPHKVSQCAIKITLLNLLQAKQLADTYKCMMKERQCRTKCNSATRDFCERNCVGKSNEQQCRRRCRTGSEGGAEVGKRVGSDRKCAIVCEGERKNKCTLDCKQTGNQKMSSFILHCKENSYYYDRKKVIANIFNYFHVLPQFSPL